MENEWFSNPHWWFSATPEIDALITAKYMYALDAPDLLNPIERILLYDQLVRHFFRNQPVAHIIEFFRRKASDIEIDLDRLDDDRFCFALMPRRHSGDAVQIYEAARLCWNREDSPIVRKFLRASYQRCPIVSIDPVVTCAPVVLSLSGGVDSMLCSVLLPNITAAVHINYGNRPTSDSEAEFVKAWCASKNIPCYVRKIAEIQREPCMQRGLRDVYESYTRKVRYACYKAFGKDATIILGHNKDDILENIFTNVAYRSKYENLDGMEEFSEQDGIRFWRPLLTMTKKEIFERAKDHGIPHLPCSTPSWSQRGKIRAKLVPVVEEWHPGFSESLHTLSESMRDLTKFMAARVDELIASANIDEHQIELKMSTMPDTVCFWRLLFTKLNIYKVSTKSIQNMLHRERAVLNKHWTMTYKQGVLRINKSKSSPSKVPGSNSTDTPTRLA